MARKHLNLGNVLRKLLFERNMKPVDLAREVNLPAPTIHRLITGKSTRPYQSSLKPIADYFSISVEQLLGNEPSNFSHSSIETDVIPIIDWKRIPHRNTETESCKKIAVTKDISKSAFGLIMPDTSMEPLFSRDCILIFDPEVLPTDRSFVLAHLHDTNIYVFRQLLIDLDHQYIKALSPDLAMFPMRMLSKKDKILACLVESRYNFQSK